MCGFCWVVCVQKACSPSEILEWFCTIRRAAGILPEKQNFCVVFIFSLFDKQTEIF